MHPPNKVDKQSVTTKKGNDRGHPAVPVVSCQHMAASTNQRTAVDQTPCLCTVWLWLLLHAKGDKTGEVFKAILGYHSQRLTMEMQKNVYHNELNWTASWKQNYFL